MAAVPVSTRDSTSCSNSFERVCDLGDSGLTDLAARYSSIAEGIHSIPTPPYPNHLPSSSAYKLYQAIHPLAHIPDSHLSVIAKVQAATETPEFIGEFIGPVRITPRKLKKATDELIKAGKANKKIKQILDFDCSAKEPLNRIIAHIPKLPGEQEDTSVDKTASADLCLLACYIYEIDQTVEGADSLNYLIWKEACKIWENTPEAERGEKPGGENWGGNNRYSSRAILQNAVENYRNTKEVLNRLREEFTGNPDAWESFLLGLRHFFGKTAEEDLPPSFIADAIQEKPEMVNLAEKIALLSPEEIKLLDFNIWNIAFTRYQERQLNGTLSAEEIKPGGDDWGYKNRYKNKEDLLKALAFLKGEPLSTEKRKSILRDTIYKYTLSPYIRAHIESDAIATEFSRVFTCGASVKVSRDDIKYFLLSPRRNPTPLTIAKYVIYHLIEKFQSIPSLAKTTFRLHDILAETDKYTTMDREKLSELFSNSLLKDVDYINNNLIIIPRFCKGSSTSRRNHSTMGLIDLENKSIVYLDSSSGTDLHRRELSDLFLSTVRNHLKKLSKLNGTCEETRVASRIGNIREWKCLAPLESGLRGVPIQNNTQNCAIFSFLYMLKYALKLPYNFTEENVVKLRENIVALIMQESSLHSS